MKKTFLCILIFTALNISCQSRNKKVDNKQVEANNMKIDILEINFSSDLDKILEKGDFKSRESEFSEYLQAEQTYDVNSFQIGAIGLLTSYNVNGNEIPNDSYVSLTKENSEANSIQTVLLRYNFIGDKNLFFDEIQKQLGAAEMLNDEDSTNTLKGYENFIWRDIDDKNSLILSQFTDGSTIGLGDVASKQINSVLIYVIDNNSEINYPNGQQEKIIDRLEDRFSQ